MHKLAFTHLIGDFIILVNLCYFFGAAGFVLGSEGVGDSIEMFVPETCPIMFGMAVFSYEGTALILPIKEAMKDKTKFNNILKLMMGITVALLVSFGLVIYFALGSQTTQIATLNFDANYTDTTLLLMYLLAIAFSFPLTVVPIHIITESFTFNKGAISQGFFRSLVVILAITIAVIFNEKADKYVSICGAIFCSPLAYILPSAINYKTKTGIGAFEKLLSIAFVVLGVGVGIFSTTLAIVNW